MEVEKTDFVYFAEDYGWSSTDLESVKKYGTFIEHHQGEKYKDHSGSWMIYISPEPDSRTYFGLEAYRFYTQNSKGGFKTRPEKSFELMKDYFSYKLKKRIKKTKRLHLDQNEFFYELARADFIKEHIQKINHWIENKDKEISELKSGQNLSFIFYPISSLRVEKLILLQYLDWVKSTVLDERSPLPREDYPLLIPDITSPVDQESTPPTPAEAPPFDQIFRLGNEMPTRLITWMKSPNINVIDENENWTQKDTEIVAFYFALLDIKEEGKVMQRSKYFRDTVIFNESSVAVTPTLLGKVFRLRFNVRDFTDRTARERNETRIEKYKLLLKTL